MLRKTALRLAAAIFAAAAGLPGLGGAPAEACNRIDGCNWETINQNRDMMASGRMDDAMRTGQDNIAAFRELLRREQEYRAWQQGAAPPRR
ncbi:MAG: hypothetical protein DI527_02395 [Chelatococcus sp.]|nr:MAG: hypothetical protein DI527_02395 [Chelatococcus sp.]